MEDTLTTKRMKQFILVIAIYIGIIALSTQTTMVIENEPTITITAKTWEYKAIELETPKNEEMSEWIDAEFSAYNNVEAQCDSSPDITASNKRIKGHEKWVAVNGYKFGTKIEIEGMGVYSVEDRMNRRYGINNIDILFHKDMEGALKFGRRNLKYRVL